MDNTNSPISSSPGQVQDAVTNNPIQPECRRTLTTAVFAANAVVPIDIPRDTCIKRLELELSFGATATYGSGSPLLSPLGVLARICPSFIVNADGSRNVKVLDLFMNRCMNALAWGSLPRRAYQIGASLLATTRQPTTEWLAGTIAYGATTQDIIVSEVSDVNFENFLAYESGRGVSMLYTKNLSSCVMQFNFGSVNSILQDGIADTVTYSALDIKIVPTIVEARDGTLANGAFDFTETVTRKQFSSQTSFFNVDLNTGNKLLGLGLMARNGDTNKNLSDFAFTDLNLVINGATSLQKTTMQKLMNNGKSRQGLAGDVFASGVHAMQGIGYMNFMKGGNLLSGIDTRLIAGVSQLQLQVSSAASTGVDAATYTNPIELSILQQQLIPVPVKS